MCLAPCFGREYNRKKAERRGTMAKPDRPGKGESRLCLPRDYTVVDTETTGLSTESCSLI